MVFLLWTVEHHSLINLITMSKSNELPSKRQEETVMPETKAKTASFTQIANDILLDQRLENLY